MADRVVAPSKAKHPLAPVELRIDDIVVKDRLRLPTDGKIEALMADIEARGLKSPIHVRSVPKVREALAHLRLIAGRSRLEAYRRLGYETIPAVVVVCSGREARYDEISENLVREELSDLDRVLSLSEQKALHAEVYGAVTHGGDRRSDQVRIMRTWSFGEMAARSIGQSPQHVRKLVRAGDAVRRCGVEKFRVSSKLPMQADLLAFAKCNPEVQDRIAQMLSDGTVLTIPEALEKLSGPALPPRDVIENTRTVVARLSPGDRDALVDRMYDILAPSFEKARARREDGDA